jgi:hypothetical protein
VWYGGGKLAADLTWPRLCQRWTGPARPADHALTVAERNAWWEHAARAADQAVAHIRALAGPDPAAAADVAWAASDTLHVAAAVLGSRILAQAADAYDRAARGPYGRIPQPTPAGNWLRQAARLMSAFAYLTGDRTLNPIILITRLAALAEAVAELRDSQQRAAQAAAAAPPPNGCTPPLGPRRPPGRKPRPVPARRPAWPRHRSPARRYHPAPGSAHRASTARTRLHRARPAGRHNPGHAAQPLSP